jgi:hypothetical protein
MDGRMDQIGRSIEQPVRATPDNVAIVINLDEIGSFDLGKRNSKGVDPEGRSVDWIAKGDVACDTLVEAMLGKDSKCRC